MRQCSWQQCSTCVFYNRLDGTVLTIEHFAVMPVPACLPVYSLSWRHFARALCLERHTLCTELATHLLRWLLLCTFSSLTYSWEELPKPSQSAAAAAFQRRKPASIKPSLRQVGRRGGLCLYICLLYVLLCCFQLSLRHNFSSKTFLFHARIISSLPPSL